MAYRRTNFGRVAQGRLTAATVGVTHCEISADPMTDQVSINGSFFESVDAAATLITVAAQDADVDVDGADVVFDEIVTVQDLSEGITRNITAAPDGGDPVVFHHDYVRLTGVVAYDDLDAPRTVRVIVHDGPAARAGVDA